MMRSLHWFRNDLRLADNPALFAASENDVLPVYILDSEDLKEMGQASKLWLHHSLNQLNESLEGKLHFIQGDSINEIRKLIDSEQIDAIYWNRVFEPKKGSKDNDLIKSLEIDYHIFNGSLLWEPESILKDDGTPYKVFTPFYRKGCIKAGETPREPLPKAKLNFISAQDQTSLDELNLLPVHPWKKKIESKWEMGENSAMKRLMISWRMESKIIKKEETTLRKVLYLDFLLIFILESSHPIRYGLKQEQWVMTKILITFAVNLVGESFLII
jgi:deoxyribodipyrimidine photo-lyase